MAIGTTSTHTVAPGFLAIRTNLILAAAFVTVIRIKVKAKPAFGIRTVSLIIVIGLPESARVKYAP